MTLELIKPLGEAVVGSFCKLPYVAVVYVRMYTCASEPYWCVCVCVCVYLCVTHARCVHVFLCASVLALI